MTFGRSKEEAGVHEGSEAELLSEVIYGSGMAKGMSRRVQLGEQWKRAVGGGSWDGVAGFEIAVGTVPAADAGRRLRQAASGPAYVGLVGEGSADGERSCPEWSTAAAWSQEVRDHEPDSAPGNIAAVHDDNVGREVRELGVAGQS